jgi:hypothetical protein
MGLPAWLRSPFHDLLIIVIGTLFILVIGLLVSLMTGDKNSRQPLN